MTPSEKWKAGRAIPLCHLQEVLGKTIPSFTKIVQGKLSETPKALSAPTHEMVAPDTGHCFFAPAALVSKAKTVRSWASTATESQALDQVVRGYQGCDLLPAKAVGIQLLEGERAVWVQQKGTENLFAFSLDWYRFFARNLKDCGGLVLASRYLSTGRRRPDLGFSDNIASSSFSYVSALLCHYGKITDSDYQQAVEDLKQKETECQTKATNYGNTANT